MTKTLSRVALDVLLAIEKADAKPESSCAANAAAVVRALMPHFRLGSALADPSNAYGEGLLARERNILMLLDGIADELEGY